MIQDQNNPMTTFSKFTRIACGGLLLSAAAVGVLSLLFTGCNKAQQNTQTVGVDTSDIYTLEVIRDRKKKDLHFLKDVNSPLKEADKGSFKGLEYYPPDKSFAFPVMLQRKAAPEPVTIAKSKDKPLEMLNIGSFTFTAGGRPYSLQVYMPKDTSQQKYWFIPFNDATNETETYHGGRFIDIENPQSDSTILDFNFCYSPYCAYNDRYDCPIPPKANTLKLAVKAGEKNYHPAQR
jgi:uncharacterized protein